MATSRSLVGQKFAVKSFRLDGIDETMLEQARVEVENHLTLDHPHIVSLMDVYETKQHLHLVMECLEGGELFDRVKEKKRFSEDEARDAVRQMLLPLHYMHSHGIVHCDVKLENFIYDQ